MSSDRKTCPLCSRMVEGGSTRCQGCGYEFKKKTATLQKGAEDLDTSNKKNCPICSRMVPQDAETCKACNYPFKKQKKPYEESASFHSEPHSVGSKSTGAPPLGTDPSQMKRCPLCSRMNMIDSEHCYGCSYSYKKREDRKYVYSDTSSPEPTHEESREPKPRPVAEVSREFEYKKHEEIPKYEVASDEPDKKVPCPVCSRLISTNSQTCYGCGYTLKRKISGVKKHKPEIESEIKAEEKKAPEIIVPPRSPKKFMSDGEMESEMKKLMVERKERLKLLREQIAADDRRLQVMKIKLNAKVEIFEDQKQKFQAKLEQLDKELIERKSSLEDEEKKLGEKEKAIAEKIGTMKREIEELMITGDSGEPKSQ